MKIYHGTVITCDENSNVYQYLVEDAGRILYVGNELPAVYQGNITELGSRALLPAFTDTHLHFASMALFQTGINAMKMTSNQEIIEELSAFIKKSKAKVIIAFGASAHSVKEKKLLSRTELDSVSDHRPIMVVKYDGHACIINSVLLRQLPESVKNSRGFNPESGEMNQEAFFATSDYVTGKIPVSELVRAMQKSVDYMAERGIGLFHTVSGVGFPRDLDVDMERYVARGVENGIQMRVFFQTMDTGKVIKRKLPRIGGCFATALDGCYGSMDAAMLEPYEGSKEKGVLYYTDEEVTQFCIRANRLGLQIEMHAIGDAAFDQATRALKAALDDTPREDARHGIIHACLPTREGIEICREYKIHIPLQTSFIDWPQEPAEYLREILGEREAALNPLRDFVDHGIMISAGSDAPCTDPDPLLWIHNACNNPVTAQALTLEEALRMATYNGCYATFDEKERGSLETGKIADMAVLDKNPYSVEKKHLKEIKVTKLYMAGVPYQKQKQHFIRLMLRGLFSKGLC